MDNPANEKKIKSELQNYEKHKNYEKQKKKFQNY